MYFYVILSVFFLLMSLLETNNVRIKIGSAIVLDKRRVRLIGILVLGVITLFRATTVGGDLANYKRFYFDVWKNAEFSVGGFITKSDPLFLVLNWFVGLFTDEFHVFVVFIGAITLFLYFKSIHRYSANMCMSFFLFITLGRIRGCFSGIRQELAVGIMLYSFRYVEERKLGKFLICWIVASMIHQTALVGIILYWFCNDKSDENVFWKYIMLLMGTFIATVFFMPVIVSLYGANDYTDNIVGGQGGTLLLVRVIILVVLLLVLSKQREKKLKDVLLTRNYAICCAFQITALGFSLANRLTYYFSVALILLIPNLLVYVNDRKTKNILQIVVGIVSLFYFIYESRNNTSGIIPYNFFWESSI